MMRLLFVCAGNTCRSPIAAAAARRLVPDASVMSAGLEAADDAPATEEAMAAANALGLDLAGHTSRRLGAADVTSADRIFVMTDRQRRVLEDRFPEAASKITKLDPGGADIEDPYGRGPAAYRAVAERIADAVAVHVAPSP